MGISLSFTRKKARNLTRKAGIYSNEHVGIFSSKQFGWHPSDYNPVDSKSPRGPAIIRIITIINIINHLYWDADGSFLGFFVLDIGLLLTLLMG